MEMMEVSEDLEDDNVSMKSFKSRATEGKVQLIENQMVAYTQYDSVLGEARKLFNEIATEGKEIFKDIHP